MMEAVVSPTDSTPWLEFFGGDFRGEAVSAARQSMSNARTIRMPKQQSEFAPAPGDASRAAATLLQWGWRKVREHVRHSYFWIGLCAYLAYHVWFPGVAAQPIQGETVASAKPIVGRWYLSEPQYTALEFQ